MSLVAVDIDYGSDVVLLPRDEARQLANAQTPPDATNAWQWALDGVMHGVPAYGPPSLVITQLTHDVLAEIYRVPSSPTDTRPVSDRPLRRWQLRVHHRHRTVVLAPNVPRRPLLESDAAQWVRWSAPPDWTALLGALNAKLADAHRQLSASMTSRALVFRPALTDDTAFRLLQMQPRAGDAAWQWLADATKTLHHNGLPPLTPYAAWASVWATLADVDAAQRRAVLEWVDSALVQRYRGRSVDADDGLWLAERDDGTVLAAYEVIALGAHALPASVTVDGNRAQRLSSGVTLVPVLLGDSAPLPTVRLQPTAPTVGTVRWYRVWASAPAEPWTGAATQVRALVTGICAHFDDAELIADGPTHNISVGDTLKESMGAAMLLAGDTVVFAVFGFDELGDPPTELPSGSLGTEAAAPLPHRRIEARRIALGLTVGAEPAVPHGPFATLAWRNLVGAAIIVAYRPATPLLPPAPIAAPRDDNIAIDDLRAVPPYTPPPPPLSATTAPEPTVSNGLALYRVWRGRDNVRRMIVAYAQRAGVPLTRALATMAGMNLSELAATVGLYRAITGEHEAVWIPLDGAPALTIAPLVLENVPLFANDRLHAAFIAWAGVAALEAEDVGVMAAHLSDATLRHIARERNRITGLLRAQQAERRLTTWLVRAGDSLDATDVPILATLNFVEPGAARDYVAARVHAYAAAAVRYRPPLHSPPRDDETADAYAARLTVEMLEPDTVSRTLIFADTQEAGAILLMRDLPISLFPAHWTEVDVHSPLPLAGHSAASLRAPVYESNWTAPTQVDADRYRTSTGNLLSLLQLDDADPTRRSVEERKRLYARWAEAFRAQVDIAFRHKPATRPQPLPANAPLATAWLRAIDNMPVPVQVLRTLRTERTARMDALRVHENNIRALYAETLAADAPPPLPDFWANGDWVNAAQSDAVLRYAAAYADVVDAYTHFDLDNTRLDTVDARWADVYETIERETNTRRAAMLARSTALIRMPLSSASGTAAPGADAPPPPPPPPPSPFALAVRAWLVTLTSDAAWDASGKEVRTDVDNGVDRAQIMATIVAHIAPVAAPPPARLTSYVQITDRYNHMMLLLADAPQEVTAAGDPIIESLIVVHQGTVISDAYAAFRAAADAAAATHQTTHTYESVAELIDLHTTMWRAGMTAAASSMQFYNRFVAVVDAVGGLARAADPDMARRLETQRSSRFFRPHPREAMFLSAALNTMTFADADATRDTTSLQRAVWSDRVQLFDSKIAAQDASTAFAWTPAELKTMLLARKTPDMLARVAVRWALMDFIARGPEARFVVPARVLERLLWALLESPDFYDARERYGLDALAADNIASVLVAVWRPGDTAYELVDEQVAAVALAELDVAAPVSATMLARTAAQLQIGAGLLWRRVLFGWAQAPSIGITRALDVRTVAELALFVVALEQQVAAAAKSLGAEDAALVGSVDRVALLHVCFAWLVAYVMPAHDRIFVQRRHPDGRMLYDDFTAAVVPRLLRDVYGVENARVAANAAWQRRWMRLAGGWLHGDLAPAPALELFYRHVVRPAVEQQPQLLWRYVPAVDPLSPDGSLAAGTTSLYVRIGADQFDVSPLAGIDRRPDAANGRPEGRDIVYNEEHNDFVPDAAYGFYEWRVGQDCFLRPAAARETAIDVAARRLTPVSAEIRALVGEEPVPTTVGVEFWLDETPLLRWFNRWAARGWHRRPSEADVAELRTQLRANKAYRLPAPDTGSDDMADVSYTALEGASIARTRLADRIRAALQEVEPQINANRAMPMPVPSDNYIPPPTLWTERGATVTLSAHRLETDLRAAPTPAYSDASYAADEKRVDAIVRGIKLYADFYDAIVRATTVFLAELPRP